MRRVLMRPIGLILAGLGSMAGAQPADWQTAPHIRVELSNFHFVPENIVLEHGRAYVLDIVNVASGGHNFAAPDFFRAAQVVPEDARLIEKGVIEVDGHSQRAIHITAPPAGHFALRCSHFLHSGFGMKGELDVR